MKSKIAGMSVAVVTIGGLLFGSAVAASADPLQDTSYGLPEGEFTMADPADLETPDGLSWPEDTLGPIQDWEIPDVSLPGLLPNPNPDKQPGQIEPEGPSKQPTKQPTEKPEVKPGDKQGDTKTNLGEKIKTTASKEKGVGESNIKNRTGSCQKYFDETGHAKNSNCNWDSSSVKGPWCAAFVTWTWKKSGAKVPGGNTNLAATYGKGAGFKKAGGKVLPKVGDAVTFKKNGKVSHVGIVTGVDKKTGKITTMEGNSGDKVSKHTYKANDSKIHGYKTPQKKK